MSRYKYPLIAGESRNERLRRLKLITQAKRYRLNHPKCREFKNRRRPSESVNKEYFTSRVLVDSKTGCWNWNGYKYPNGYAGVRYGGKSAYCHRVAYMLWKGPIPDGLLVCHKCDNRTCCNPDHLFLGTYADNSQDCLIKGRFRPQNKKISDAQVIAIREDRRRQWEIAKEYNISQATVSEIKTGRKRSSSK